MSYIYRELLYFLVHRITASSPCGLILSGVVGCGKTTLVEKLLDYYQQNTKIKIFTFTGDDIQFRQAVSENSRYLLEFVLSRTTDPALIFVDEVQKTEAVFDALKIAFDSKKISFIVSGSNPAYLSTIAKKRLQRRAHQVYMLPLSLMEIFTSLQYLQPGMFEKVQDLFYLQDHLKSVILPEITLTKEMKYVIDNFLSYGGLPLSYLSEDPSEKLRHIRLTTERGFEVLSVDNMNIAELIKIELAQLHSKEFTYQNLLNRTRLRRRDSINLVINELMDHGYLLKKKPMLLPEDKTSYLSVYSYIDPGIVCYLRGSPPMAPEMGNMVEGYVHARLDYYVKNSVFKSELGYYKPHTQGEGQKLKYLPGEIDFILKKGSRILPIEVKSTDQISNIDVTIMKKFILQHQEHVPFGMILYGGVPYKDNINKILYWPYWMI